MTTLADARTVPAAQRAEAWMPLRALTDVLVISALVIAVVVFVLLVPLDGWTYYRTPRAIRGYHHAHRLLRPSGPIGQALGLSGLAMMLVPILYAVRKKSARLARFGSMKTWLQVHIFCGIVGPVLVTFHASFKFNGIVSVAYWMMVLVASSGFVGRYLYVRIPHSMRGTELSLGEVQGRAATLKAELAVRGLPPWVMARVETIETQLQPPARPGGWIVNMLTGDLALRLRLWRLRRDLRHGGADPLRASAITSLIAERAVILRRLALLERTRRLFHLWHLFHHPLVWVLVFIVFLHVAIVTYMGYTVFSRFISP